MELHDDEEKATETCKPEELILTRVPLRRTHMLQLGRLPPSSLLFCMVSVEVVWKIIPFIGHNRLPKWCTYCVQFPNNQKQYILSVLFAGGDQRYGSFPSAGESTLYWNFTISVPRNFTWREKSLNFVRVNQSSLLVKNVITSQQSIHTKCPTLAIHKMLLMHTQ